jgi:uncharacterized protein (TIGR03435 family)
MLRIVTTVLAGLLIAVAPSARAQSSRPRFEVASVKANKSVSVGGAYSNLGQRGGHVTITKFSLRMLMGQAYGLPTLSDAFDRIVGLPTWADTEYFDMEAQSQGDPGASQKRLMLQSLLEDRFKLGLRYQRRQRAVFALVWRSPESLVNNCVPIWMTRRAKLFLIQQISRHKPE